MTRNFAGELALKLFGIYALFQGLDTAMQLAVVTTHEWGETAAAFDQETMAFFLAAYTVSWLVIAGGLLLTGGWLALRLFGAGEGGGPTQTGPESLAAVAFAAVGLWVIFQTLPEVALWCANLLEISVGRTVAGGDSVTRMAMETVQLIAGLALFFYSRNLAAFWWRKQRPLADAREHEEVAGS